MEENNNSEFSHEILERFQKLVKNKKITNNSLPSSSLNSPRIIRSLTKQVSNTIEEIK